MEYLMNEISFSFIFGYLIAGITLYVILYLVEHYVLPLLPKNKHRMQKWWVKFRTVIWLVFLCLFLYGSFQENMIITLSFGSIILGLGWFFWRNLFAGLLIQFSDEFKVGDYISTDFATGELTKIGLAQSELINPQGELVILPNHQLRNAVLKHIAKKSNVKTHTFELKTPQAETIQKIQQKALHNPYISANQPVVVESLSSTHFQIKVALVDAAFLDRARGYFEGGTMVL